MQQWGGSSSTMRLLSLFIVTPFSPLGPVVVAAPMTMHEPAAATTAHDDEQAADGEM